MWGKCKQNLSLLPCKHSTKVSQNCIISKELEFLKFHLFYGNFVMTFVCLILARNYNSPRTVSVKALTMPVATEPILRAIKHLLTRLTAHNKQ